jgi:lipoprotein-releasing system ATP-binding protein
MTLIRVHNLHKTYRLGRVSVPVLRGAEMSVSRGEWVAVLGASGSGKSTLLHLMGGLDRPDRNGERKGDVEFDGRALSAYSSRELDRFRAERVGFVFQFYHLLPELTVLENVLVAAMVQDGRVRYSQSRREPEAAALLDAFGLSHRLRHRPAELSGGERQRVAIARALVNEPDILLADEPTGNLDRHTGEKILDTVTKIRAVRNQTIVMVTHDREVAARADRIVRLDDGQVVPE